MIVATTQFSLQSISVQSQFWLRVERLCGQAKSQNAQMILFPEYFALSFQLANSQTLFRKALIQGDALEREFIKEFQLIADKYDLCIVAGSFAHARGDSLYNRSYIFRPKMQKLYQDKIHMTRFEKEDWLIQRGKPSLQIFTWKGATCAVAICYDVEFPSYCAAARAAKVDILLVPSCTDDVHSYWRVRHCAEARAIENQCFVVLSSVVEGNDTYPEIESHYGKGIIQSPCDLDFPAMGLLAEGQLNQEGLVIADLNLALLYKIRASGSVLNLNDQENQEPIHFQGESLKA